METLPTTNLAQILAEKGMPGKIFGGKSNACLGGIQGLAFAWLLGPPVCTVQNFVLQRPKHGGPGLKVCSKDIALSRMPSQSPTELAGNTEGSCLAQSR